jgi:peptidylprolyl isomerase
MLMALILSVTTYNAESKEANMTNGEDTIVVLETNQGNIELKMFPKVAPLAVENFTTHVKNGYYNGLIFHRVIKNFMIQGGDPTGTGRGGESIWHKEFINEHAPNVVFDRPFLLAMANHGKNTNGSQFFITTQKTPWLNGGYTIFGEVVKGQDVVKKIENTKTGRGDRPISEQKILKAYIKQ